MHAGAGEVADDVSAVFKKSENDNDTACLIFAQKASGAASDDHNGNLLLIGFHMDSGAVAGVALYVDPASAHGVTGSVSNAAADQDLSLIHRVPDGILRIAFYGNT